MRKFKASKAFNSLHQIDTVVDKYYKAPIPEKRVINWLTDQEIYDLRGVMVMDIEVYPNYFLVMFKHIETGKVCSFEISPDNQLNKPIIRFIMWKYTVVTFNGTNFDIPLLWLALNQEMGAGDMAMACSTIINTNARARDILAMYKFKLGKMHHHIDLIEVAPQSASLKLYGGRLHTKRLQDLPFDPNMSLTKDQSDFVKHYCVNDLDLTIDLWNELSGEMELRRSMSREYDIDLCSKSDAQIAEAVICNEIKKLTGYYPPKPKDSDGMIFKYRAPDFISFQTEQLQKAFETIKNCDFHLDGGGSPVMPATLSDLKIKIGSSTYKMGMGGLHSSESGVSHQSDDNYFLSDVDVTSYYPYIILNQGLFPAQLGERFLKIFNSIVTRRVAAKREGNRVVNESLKIVINGSFGKFGSKWSRLYSPDLMIQTTITGQLALLMLIEYLELNDIAVVSGNTDGIVVKCSRARKSDLEDMVKVWENHTSFNMEYTYYKGIYSRDVNSYLAVTEKGSVKSKGFYGGSILKRRLWKNPQNLICNEAVQQLLKEGTPIDQTIDNCDDIRKFLTVRTVRGGARKDNSYLGKAIRWYYKKNEFGTINYVDGGNKVPTSDGAWPCMDLPDSLPNDIDYDWYVNRANEMLYEIGYFKNNSIV